VVRLKDELRVLQGRRFMAAGDKAKEELCHIMCGIKRPPASMTLLQHLFANACSSASSSLSSSATAAHVDGQRGDRDRDREAADEEFLQYIAQAPFLAAASVSELVSELQMRDDHGRNFHDLFQ
jgi:hypothetical protein